jgi:ubiquinone/menaquinone biosynthesis C-methylase UbiE
VTRVAVGEGRAFHDLHRADIETASENYARRFEGAVGAWLLEHQARCALELISRASPDRLSILDVGGGHAQLALPLLRAGHRLVVQGSAVVCHERLARERSRLDCVTSDLWQLPFPDRCFDLVSGIRLLAHVDDWRGLLREMARVSRRLVLVDAPLKTPLHRLAPRLFDRKRSIELNTRPYFDYRPEDVMDALRACGLHIAGEVRQYALPMVLHRTLANAALSRNVEAALSAVGVTDRWGSPGLFLATRRN